MDLLCLVRSTRRRGLLEMLLDRSGVARRRERHDGSDTDGSDTDGSNAIATATVATLTSSGAMPWQWQGTLVTTGIERRLGILPQQRLPLTFFLTLTYFSIA